MQIVRAITRTWIGEHLMLVENSLWPADDPLVLAHPNCFTSDLEPILQRTAPAKVAKRTTATQPMVEAR